MMDPTKRTTKGESQPPLHPANFDTIVEAKTLDLFLLAGQSNMKGRATIPMTPKEDENILFFHSKQERWYTARDPLHAQGVPDLIDGSDNSGTGSGSLGEDGSRNWLLSALEDLELALEDILCRFLSCCAIVKPS
jgi:hypothetical protein